MPVSYTALDPTQLRASLSDGTDLKGSISTPPYTTGTPSSAAEVSRSVIDAAGNVKKSITNAADTALGESWLKAPPTENIYYVQVIEAGWKYGPNFNWIEFSHPIPYNDAFALLAINYFEPGQDYRIRFRPTIFDQDFPTVSYKVEVRLGWNSTDIVEVRETHVGQMLDFTATCGTDHNQLYFLVNRSDDPRLRKIRFENLTINKV